MAQQLTARVRLRLLIAGREIGLAQVAPECIILKKAADLTDDMLNQSAVVIHNVADAERSWTCATGGARGSKCGG